MVIAEGNTVPESTRVTRFSSAVTSDKDNIRTCDFSTLCDEFWTALNDRKVRNLPSSIS